MTAPHSASSSDRVVGDSRRWGDGYAEERVAPRTPGSLVPNIERVRLLPPGVDASIVNISVRGVLVSCRKKLGAGMPVRIVFEGNGVPPPTSGKVARSLVSRIGQSGEIWYDVGIAFDQPIEFESPTPEAMVTASHAGESPAETTPATTQFVNRW